MHEMITSGDISMGVQFDWEKQSYPSVRWIWCVDSSHQMGCPQIYEEI